jgi:hypothetical protein
MVRHPTSSANARLQKLSNAPLKISPVDEWAIEKHGIIGGPDHTKQHGSRPAHPIARLRNE